MIPRSLEWMRSKNSETADPLPGLPSQHQTTKEFITIRLRLLILFWSLVMESVSPVMITIILWLLVSRLRRRLHTILFILIWPIALFRSNPISAQVSVNNVELLFMRERASTVCVRSDKKNYKKHSYDLSYT